MCTVLGSHSPMCTVLSSHSPMCSLYVLGASLYIHERMCNVIKVTIYLLKRLLHRSSFTAWTRSLIYFSTSFNRFISKLNSICSFLCINPYVHVSASFHNWFHLHINTLKQFLVVFDTHRWHNYFSTLLTRQPFTIVLQYYLYVCRLCPDH